MTCYSLEKYAPEARVRITEDFLTDGDLRLVPEWARICGHADLRASWNNIGKRIRAERKTPGGKDVRYYNNARDAAKDTGVCSATISHHISGKVRPRKKDGWIFTEAEGPAPK